ncbi:MAG: hypothetical protein COZ70_05770 [Deltaproteobacteria bacterium CG_4_8_14_3_um_filter_51_11]|nr:MAG: hypothetical protein COX16_15230 [Deltaproteobacteria bacterium CG23_combo_of_CG06-09_8_20_14_all_51_20]PIX20041.1 MAG: hypothetical protein COZ70_05770 [Deltaproteobacteria bacterium CG_4_8_14_3_um_filter_51_11]PIY25647.1 MAG: hypothetical protein COZ11_04755 [Deltaproteobacteria bacterium CG_4_10_14_3_um_filter_51_14]PJB36598.1 MAG: hypothetical protein CO107_07295 [Deltaproteobacteria bacterium CG_4_9_14_3_um_filter_51_14]
MNRINRLYLLRHGQVMDFASFPIYGHTDVDMTETGILQMEMAAKRLKLATVSAIYASDLKRAHAGALIIACHHDVPVKVEKDLREMYFGAWEGSTLSHLRENYAEELSKRQADPLNYRAPGGAETLSEFSHRIINCMEKIFDANKGGKIVIVAHGGTNRVILAQALRMKTEEIFRIHQDYGCLNIIDYFPESALVRLFNG